MKKKQKKAYALRENPCFGTVAAAYMIIERPQHNRHTMRCDTRVLPLRLEHLRIYTKWYLSYYAS